MFSVNALWENKTLAPLKKVYDVNENDPRLVVVVVDGEFNLAETESLHRWLEKLKYKTIPSSWNTVDGLDADVIHVSQLAVEILRRNPFSRIDEPEPLNPNHWLNNLRQDHFDALLLAQETGNVPMQPTKAYIMDTLKPALEAPVLSAFWKSMMSDVKFAMSGAAPKNAEQKAVIAAWGKAVKRRHYDPTAAPVVEERLTSEFTTVREYVWTDGSGQYDRHRVKSLRKWIVSQTRNENDLRMAAIDVLGSDARVDFGGAVDQIAFSLLEEVKKVNKLSQLANYYNYVQQETNVEINTGGGAYVGGNIIVNGDFVGGNKFSR